VKALQQLNSNLVILRKKEEEKNKKHTYTYTTTYLPTCLPTTKEFAGRIVNTIYEMI
jgi:hypothetical protein